MKKTLVALAVLAAAGQAQAIELYNADKVTVNMTGDIEVVYVKSKMDKAEFKQEIQDADFGFDTRYAMNDDLQVGAFWEFKGADTNNVKGAQVGDVYMGLYSASVGSIKFGKQTTVLDGAGIGGDYQFGISSFFQNGTPFAGHEVIKYELDTGSFYGAVAYMQDKNGYNGLGEDGNFFDAKLGYRVADFDFTAFYGQSKIESAASTVYAVNPTKGYTTTTKSASDSKESILAIEARYAGLENTNLALAYYNNSAKGTKADVSVDYAEDPTLNTNKAGGDFKGSANTYAAAGDYTMGAWTFGAGVSLTQLKDDAKLGADKKDNFTAWYANVGYALAPSTTAYAEVGGDNFYTTKATGGYNTEAKSQTGFAVGLKAVF